MCETLSCIPKKKECSMYEILSCISMEKTIRYEIPSCLPEETYVFWMKI